MNGQIKFSYRRLRREPALGLVVISSWGMDSPQIKQNAVVVSSLAEDA